MLKDVTFKDVPHSYVNAVLAAIGPQLLKLELWSCKDIDIFSFVPCVLLEELVLMGPGTSLLQHEDEAIKSIQTDSFLPCLQKLKSAVCLGNWSRFFEGKSPLTELSLYCSHVGISNDGSVLWDKLPTIWANLKSLSIHFAASGLTMSNLCQFLPGLKRLKSVTLPDSVNSTDQDKALANRLKEQLGFHLKFVSPEFCRFLYS